MIAFTVFPAFAEIFADDSIFEQLAKLSGKRTPRSIVNRTELAERVLDHRIQKSVTIQFAALVYDSPKRIVDETFSINTEVDMNAPFLRACSGPDNRGSRSP